MTTFRERIVEALDEVLRSRNIPHIGISTKKSSSMEPPKAVVYVDYPPEELPPDIRAEIPAIIKVKRWFRKVSVGVQIQNIGQIEPQAPAPGR